MSRISIITPCYNSEKFISRTIESVRNQTYTDWEHIVVDDGSTDGSATVVRALLPFEPRLKFIQQPNGDRANACNNGFRYCSADSEYLLFLDADDCLEPHMLEVMSRHLDTHPEVGLAHCDCKIIDEMDRPLDKRTHSYLSPRYAPAWFGVRRLPTNVIETPFVSIFCLAGIICSLSLIRKSVYERTPGWDESFGFMYDDTDLFLHIAIRSKIHFISQELVFYRRHHTQSTAFANPRFAGQETKLYAKWQNMIDLSTSQMKTIEEANRFRQWNFRLFRAFRAANKNLKRGNLWLAFRNYWGIFRYMFSYLILRNIFLGTRGKNI